MTLRKIPDVKVSADLGQQLDANFVPGVLDRWCPGVRAAEAGQDNVISIYEPIGEDPWTGAGMTAKRIAGILRNIGARAVQVNINSPGGDLFEGLAIYNLLREHPAEVTVKVVGLAASAASIIAMAGDKIEIAKAGFYMLHNAWVMAMGNRHDLRDVAQKLDAFDNAIAEIYAARTGAKVAAMAALMDKETWLSGSQAIDEKFADGFLPSDQVASDAKAEAELQPSLALRKIDLALARNGMPRSERRDLIKQFAGGTPCAAAHEDGGTPRAAAAATPRAGDPALLAALAGAIQTLKR